MEWWIIGGLGAVVVMLISVYRISLRENRGLANYVILVLMDEGVHKVQRESLMEFLRRNNAKTAVELGWDVRQATQSLAMKHADNLLGVNAVLWHQRSR